MQVLPAKQHVYDAMHRNTMALYRNAHQVFVWLPAASARVKGRKRCKGEEVVRNLFAQLKSLNAF